MAQLTEQDVRRLVAAAEKAERERPAIRPEDVERITAITSETDPVLRARKMDAWIAETKAQIEANSRELEALSRGKAGQRDGGAKLSPAAEAELRRSVEGYADRVADAVQQEARAAAGQQQARPGRPPRPGRLRV